jgi:hypothetical protein
MTMELLARIVVGSFALSVVALTALLAGHFAWLAFRGLRAARYKLAVLSGAAIVAVAASFVAVALVWFGYGVAHSHKDFWTDLRVVLATGVPFYGISYLLWRTSRHVRVQLSG